MAKRKVKDEEVESQAEVAAPEEADEDNGDSVTVTWKGGSRVYSREVHGKEFKAYAKEFAAKKNGEVA